MQPLTDNQRRIAEENHNLIYGFLHKRKLDIDEWYGDMAVAFVEAVGMWNPSRGTLSTFAFIVMGSHHARILQADRYLKRKALVQSLDAPLTDDTDSTLGEVLPDSVSVEDDAVFLAHLETANAQLTDRQRKIIKLVAAGCDQSDIAARLGTSQPQVSRDFAAAKCLIFGKKIAPCGGGTPTRRTRKISVLKV